MIALAAYIPVLHQGYLNWIGKYPEARELWVVDRAIAIENLPELKKDIRALDPQSMVNALKPLLSHLEIKLMNAETASSLAADKVIVADDDVMRVVAEKYWPGKISYDSVFLRWDKTKSLAEMPVTPDDTISTSEFDQQMMSQAQDLAPKSSDWWRQVGAVLVKGGKILVGEFNHHVPRADEPYFNGDPRGNFHKGEHLDKTTAMHAEARLIAKAAEVGLSTYEAEVYVTTFPCPTCAKLLAAAGIKKLFFETGYAMIDGQSVLKAAGIEIIRVQR